MAMLLKIFMIVVGISVCSCEIYEPLFHHASEPYAFGYIVKDHHGEQHREETGDGHHGVKGSYGFTDDRGVHRQVHYMADHEGFRAHVKTNEPGTANQDPAAVHVISSAHPYIEEHEGHGSEHGLVHHGLRLEEYKSDYGREGYEQADGLEYYEPEEGYGYGFVPYD